MAARTFRKKKQQQSHVFFGVIFMFTLTWITEKELERVIENNIPFPCLAKHIVLSKFWKVDLDRKVI